MNTKKYIESALLELLEKKSIDKIKVNEIIRMVGTCKGTFYKYYRDKYELLISCFRNNYYAELIASSHSWEEFTVGCLTMFEKDPVVILNAFDSRDVNSVRYYHDGLIAEYLETNLKKNGEEMSKLSRFSAKTCASIYTDIMLDWLSHGMKESKEELITYMRAAMPQVIYPKIYASV